MNVKEKTVDLYITESKITADFMADRIEHYWFSQKDIKEKTTLVINSDNGPENNSHRRQYMKRMVELSMKANIIIILAYYPPYHSKYNPVERAWGALEQHWNGELLDSKETIIKFAETMKYNSNHPKVSYIDDKYNLGITLKKKEMDIYESVLERAEGIEDWFVKIIPSNCYKVFGAKSY